MSNLVVNGCFSSGFDEWSTSGLAYMYTNYHSLCQTTNAAAITETGSMTQNNIPTLAGGYIILVLLRLCSHVMHRLQSMV